LRRAEQKKTGEGRGSGEAEGKGEEFHKEDGEKVDPARLTVEEEVQVISGTPLKTFPYSHRLDILNRATAKSYDEAIVVNSQGKLCEGSVTNLLLKIDDTWCTPPISDGVLPGVMRALVVEYLSVQVRRIHVDVIPQIQSAFLLSSLRIAQPVASIQGRELTPSDEFAAEIRAMALRTSVG
jgi:branched-chain amino acid aminotransferase